MSRGYLSYWICLCFIYMFGLDFIIYVSKFFVYYRLQHLGSSLRARLTWETLFPHGRWTSRKQKVVFLLWWLNNHFFQTNYDVPVQIWDHCKMFPLWQNWETCFRSQIGIFQVRMFFTLLKKIFYTHEARRVDNIIMFLTHSNCFLV